ncbi:MAG: efflux RND transporter periplasmic adaptor subunit [Sulfurimonas sp.]|nr:efflux RND transporter periplasmic adaptor subunit [Sulfurimonas sp.]
MLKGLKNYIAIILVAVLVAVSGYFIYIKINGKELPDGLVASSGRIDGDLILINTKYPARIENIFVKEGDRVTENQIVAKLLSNEFLSKYESLHEAINSIKDEKLSFEQTIEASKMELKLLEKTLPNLVKIKEDDLKTIKKTLSSVNLKIKTVSFNFQQSKREYKRYKKLFETKAITSEKFELVDLKYKITKQELESAKVDKEKLLSSINIAKTSLQIQKDNLKKIDILKQNIRASQTKLKSLGAKIKQLEANRDEVQAMIDELTLKSPIDGFVIEKIANIGEVVGAGMGVVTLSDTKSYYLKLFIDTMNNGKIKIGDNAVIFLDSNPNKPIKAKVIQIAQKAEFTPKDVSVRSDRIQRVYAVRLKPIKYNPILKLGIPAIGIIGVDGVKLPNSLDEIPEL